VSPTLVAPTAELRAAWLEAHAEWGPGLHEDGFGLTATDDVGGAEGFEAWVARLAADAEHATCRWIVDDGRVLGGIALRHELDDRTGHIGYGIRPSARGRGLATWALAAVLEEARRRGMDRVLLVCADENAASTRTIERNGGVLAEVRVTPRGTTRRYWIDLQT
jgi:predicted acetyltransferase